MCNPEGGGIPREFKTERRPASKRPIEVLWDLDGVIFRAEFLGKEFPPLPTIFKLLKGDNLAPKDGMPNEWRPPKGLIGALGSRLSVCLHDGRHINPEAVKALIAFKEAAARHQRTLKNSVLSGRTKDKHALTERRLREEGCLDLFDRLDLNLWKSGTQWKMARTWWAVQLGKTVIGIDDDIQAGIAAASAGPKNRVREYVICNASNAEILLRRAKVVIPQNLVLVKSLEEAVEHFDRIVDELE
ncbi:MAG: hypothetical protein Q8Q15_02960 [bacterium]|nr:hypothetical protein [bacterium]